MKQASSADPFRDAGATDRKEPYMTQYERMQAGLLYDSSDPEIAGIQDPCKDRIWEFNRLKPTQTAEKERLLKEMFAECGESCYIEAPLYANWGGRNVHFGSFIYVNFHLTLVDDAQIYVGDHVMIGPNVTICTGTHPVNPELRLHYYQYNRDVRIEENVWIGAGALIMPGVHIGRNSVIGAGSVVLKDIPDNVIAVGNPCRVLRPVDERDACFYDHGRKIDWEEIHF